MTLYDKGEFRQYRTKHKAQQGTELTETPDASCRRSRIDQERIAPGIFQRT